MNVATYHEIDPLTGMIQTTGNYPYAFNVEKKQMFLERYKANSLSFYRTCKEMGLHHSVVNHHYDIDPVFKDHMKLAEREYYDQLQAVSRDHALDPNRGVIERIFHLKAGFPEKYAEGQKSNEQNITINLQGNLVIDAKKRAEMIDAEIIREQSETEQTLHSSAKIQEITCNPGDMLKPVDAHAEPSCNI